MTLLQFPPRGPLADLHRAYLEADRFVIFVQMVTGWDRKTANRLRHRIDKLGPHARDEWGYRYLAGWGSVEIRTGVMLGKIVNGM